MKRNEERRKLHFLMNGIFWTPLGAATQWYISYFCIHLNEIFFLAPEGKRDPCSVRSLYLNIFPPRLLLKDRELRCLLAMFELYPTQPFQACKRSSVHRNPPVWLSTAKADSKKKGGLFWFHHFNFKRKWTLWFENACFARWRSKQVCN